MTPAQEQPIWVQDLMAWLEKIQSQTLDGEQRAAQLEEVLAELPGQGLPEEYWVKAKESDGGEELEEDSKQNQLLQQWKKAEEIRGWFERWKALKVIIEEISPDEKDLLEDFLEKVRETDNGAQGLLLSSIAAKETDDDKRQKLVDEAIEILEPSANNDESRNLFQQVVACILSTTSESLHELLDLAQATQNSEVIIIAIGLLPNLNSVPNKVLLDAALDAAQAIESEEYQVQALAAVAAQLPASERQSVLESALDAAKAIEDGELRAYILAAVAAQLPASEPQLLEAALDAAKAIEDEDYRSSALATVTAQLPASERQSVLKEALKTAKAIENQEYRSQALAAVAAQLPASERQSVLKEALDAAKTIENQGYRSQALAAVAAQLPASERQSVLKEALDAAKTIEYEEFRSQALAAVAAQLPASDPQLLEAVLEAAKAIEFEYYRAPALATLAPQLPTSEYQSVLEEVLDAAFKIENKYYRINDLSGVAFHATEFLLLQSPLSQISTILEIIPKGQTSTDKAKLLSALAPRLSSGLFPRALQLIQTEITHPAYQAEALSNLAPYLPTEQLSEAIALVDKNVDKHIVGYSYPTTALCNLIPRLSLEQLNQAFDIAIARIPQPDLLTKIFQAIVTRLNTINPLQEQNDDGTKKQLIQAILDHIQNPLFNEKSVTAIITAFAPSLNFNFDDSQTERLKTLLNQIQSEYNRAQVITAISPYLSKENLNDFLTQAEALRQERPKAKALSALMAAYLETLPDSLTESISKLKESSSNPIRDAEIALIFATRPHPKSKAQLAELTRDQSLTLRLIRNQSNDYLKANYLIQLAPHLLNSQAIEAQSIAQDIQDVYHRARSLVALATRFPQVRADAQRQIKQVETKSDIQHIELLCQFATILPETISTLLKTIEDWDSPEPSDELSIEDEQSDENREQVTDPNRKNYKRTLILKALKPHLPIRLSREIDRQTRIGKAPQDLWERSLFVLRNEYRQALKSGSLRNDAAQDEDLLNLKDEINALTEMLLMRDLTPPVVVGILGGWGGGKSYIMHLMQRHMVEIRSRGMDAIEAWGLKDDKSSIPDSDRVSRYVGHIYQIKFDAWTYAKSNLWASLMQTIFFELDRQITLEQQIKEALNKIDGIKPLDQQSGAIWQALYETSEEDRKWFLANALNQKAFKEWEENSQIQSNSDQLWDLFATSQTEAIENLKQVEKKLTEKQKELKTKQDKILKGTLENKLFLATSQTLLVILNQRLGTSFAKDFQEKVLTQLTKTVEDTKETFSQANQWHDSIKVDIENVFEQEDSLINWRFIQEFIRKNRLLILLCLTLVVVAILLSSILAANGFNQLTQIFAGITPLFGAIPIAQGLFKKGQTLYGEVKLSIVEYKKQLEQSIQRQLDTDQEFRKINRQVQLLEKEVEAQYATIPTNIYASVAEFVSNRLQKGGYQDHLGIMHQVKEDLAMLSKRLLPPLSNSKEYTAKIKQLQTVFPRGPARVFLYIDDLDRCPPKTVVEVLEAVQLLVKNPLFIAILAIDERYITRALADHYKGVLPLKGRPSASDYLEKIIQIPYRVRPISQESLRQYLRAQIVVQDSETGGTKFNEFSPEEFNLLVTCCQEAELSPRSLKRLTNVYKLYKVLSRTRGQTPSPKEQKTILTLLAFSGRYPDLMRDVLQEIGTYYEQGQDHADQNPSETLANIFNLSLDKFKEDTHLGQDAQQLRDDVRKLVSTDLKLIEIRGIFDFVRTFSFVGDIGVDMSEK